MTSAADPLKTLRHLAIPTDDIVPHPDNPRRITDDHPSLDGLAKSILETGLINPITVRENALAEGDDKPFQILAGERRWRAARKAGLKMVACRIVEVTDEQAFHILTVENLQREDLHWTEEARGVEAMLAKGWAAEAIARAIGRTVQWVAGRKALLDLSPAWKKELEDPKSDWHDIPLNKLELIARFPHDTQDHIREHARWDFEELTAKQFEDYLATNYLRKLSKAPWKLDDAELVPAAGACAACPKRSSCQTQLFGETKDDACLDSVCWQAKQGAQVLRQIERAKAKTPGAILLREGYGDDVPAALSKADQLHKYKLVKKDDRGATPAVVVNGGRAGQTIWVKLDPIYRGNDKPAAAIGAEKPKGKTLVERKRAVEKRRENLVAQAFLEWIEQQAEKMAPAALDERLLFALCLRFGVSDHAMRHEPPEGATAAAVKLAQGGTTELHNTAWQQVAPMIQDAVGSCYRAGNPPIEGIRQLCDLLGWGDLLGRWSAKAVDEIPTPRALAEDIALAEASAKAKAAKPKPPGRAGRAKA